MDDFFSHYKDLLLRKISERADNFCYGCMVAENDIRHHSCREKMTGNIQRHFNVVFTLYMKHKRQVMERLQIACMHELLKEYVGAEEARCLAQTSRNYFDLNGGDNLVSSSSAPPLRGEAADN